MKKLYIRTPHTGNEHRVCDELTDNVIATFDTQKDAIKFVDRITELNAIISECHKDNSVASAIRWAKAIKERSNLLSK